MAEREKIVSLKQVSKAFPVGKNLLGRPDKFVHAVNNVSFDIYKGETFSVVGESGCGKSTTGRLLDHLITPDSGEIWFCGQEISHYTQARYPDDLPGSGGQPESENARGGPCRRAASYSY